MKPAFCALSLVVAWAPLSAACANEGNGSARVAPAEPTTPHRDLSDKGITKALAVMVAIGEELGKRLLALIVDSSEMPDLDRLPRMNRRELQQAADQLARAGARARGFDAAAAAPIAQARRKVEAVCNASGNASFAAGLRDGFDETATKLFPRLSKLSAMFATYDDAARTETLFLLTHYDRIVRTHDGLAFREDRLVAGYNRLVERRNRSGKIAKAYAAEIDGGK